MVPDILYQMCAKSSANIRTLCILCIVGGIIPLFFLPMSSQAQGNHKPTTSPKDKSAIVRKKIAFDLDQIDKEGLRGPSDGKVTVSYEFCIPDTKRCRAEVKRLDPTVSFLAGSSGHIGAKKGQCLCIGNTHQKRWRATLERLAALPYIERIIQAWFE